jgi:hypothetical protein
MLLKWREFMFPLRAGGMASLILLAAVSVQSAQNPALPKNGEALSPPPAVNSQTALITPKPKEEPKKSSREKTKTDAADLSALADKLSTELSKMNINVLSLDVIKKTKEIEELAKKIREEANEH